MADAADFRRIALSLEGRASEHPHFDRRAFKARITFATLAPDERTANFKFAPDEQALKCVVAPDAFGLRLDNAWGRQGWTSATLAALSEAELERGAGDGLASRRAEAEGAKAARRGKSFAEGEASATPASILSVRLISEAGHVSRKSSARLGCQARIGAAPRVFHSPPKAPSPPLRLAPRPRARSACA